MWLNSLVSGKQRSADELCKKGHYWLFIYIACVCVVETFSTGKWHNALNKYIHKYAKHFTVDGEKKKSGDRVFREEKKYIPWWMSGDISQSTHWRGGDGRQRLIPGWLNCRSATVRMNGSFFSWKTVLKRRIRPLCRWEIWRPSSSHGVNSKERVFPQNHGDLSKVINREPCTQNYLITVHMLIYSTTTSICAFWTVTKWCFIACCIDDANYNCYSTILE